MTKWILSASTQVGIQLHGPKVFDLTGDESPPIPSGWFPGSVAQCLVERFAIPLGNGERDVVGGCSGF